MICFEFFLLVCDSVYKYLPFLSIDEKGCAECDRIIEELEKIDDHTDRNGIHFVKTDDVRLAEDLGVTEFPTLVYFEHQIPSIFSGVNF